MEEYFPRNAFQDTTALLQPELGLPESQALTYLILEKIFCISKTDMIINRPFFPDHVQKKKYNHLIERLLDHEPFQYIFNEAEFCGRNFYVDRHVLIPRQETELLIQLIANIKKWNKPKIADIGVGSGCIACSLALDIEGAKVFGYDISEEALMVAQYNSVKLGARVHFSILDILEQEIPQTNLELIVSNPPYVREQERSQMNKNVLDFEPKLALFVPDHDPLLFYKKIMQKAKGVLIEGGILFFEINEAFGKQLLLLFKKYGYKDATLYKDLHGKDRFAAAVSM